MRGWSILALALWAALVAYTAIVIGHHGLGLLPIFFGDMGRMEWSGQFNFDFMLMLFVSASWTAWRNDFTPRGLVLGAGAFGFGAAFLLIYLAWLIRRHGGAPAPILLGERRANQRNTGQ